jgi:hypothetical protein
MESEKLRGVYTNRERARLTDEMVREITRVTAKNERVIIYGSAPMLYYLTDTVPLLDNPWTELYSYRRFEGVFRANVVDAGIKPKIILLNFNANDNGWPVYNPEAYRRYSLENDGMFRFLDGFINANGYYKSNPGEMFDIYLPSE